MKNKIFTRKKIRSIYIEINTPVISTITETNAGASFFIRKQLITTHTTTINI